MYPHGEHHQQRRQQPLVGSIVGLDRHNIRSPSIWCLGDKGCVAYVPYGTQFGPIQNPFINGSISGNQDLSQIQGIQTNLNFPFNPPNRQSAIDLTRSPSPGRRSDSSDSDQTEGSGSSTDTCEIEVDKIASVVVFLASNVEKEVDSIIPIDAIDWRNVAAYFKNHSSEECLSFWKENFAKYNLVKHHSGGAVLYHENDLPQNVTNKKRSRIDRSVANQPAPQSEHSTVNLGYSNPPPQMGEEGGEDRSKRAWTEAEIKRVEELRKVHGNRWKEISKKLGNGRSGAEIKNYWHTNEQRLARKVLKDFRNQKVQSSSNTGNNNPQ